jgi:hypothetical protein
MLKQLAALSAVALAALAVASAASADGPVITTETVSMTNLPFGPRCGAEAILASFTVTRRIQSFYDGTQLVLQRRHAKFDGTLTLLSTGVTLPYEGDFTVATDFVSRTLTVTGEQSHVVLPGSGIVLQNTGRLDEDISTLPPTILDEAGPHDNFDPGGTEAVCTGARRLGAPGPPRSWQPGRGRQGRPLPVRALSNRKGET